MPFFYIIITISIVNTMIRSNIMNYKLEIEKRVEWIKKLLLDTGTKGIVYGNSGGKDSTLVGLLAK